MRQRNVAAHLSGLPERNTHVENDASSRHSEIKKLARLGPFGATVHLVASITAAYGLLSCFVAFWALLRTKAGSEEEQYDEHTVKTTIPVVLNYFS